MLRALVHVLTIRLVGSRNDNDHYDCDHQKSDCKNLRQNRSYEHLCFGGVHISNMTDPIFRLIKKLLAVDFIHSQLLEARNKGVAILLLSEDLDELVALSDRLVVMAAGKIVYSAPIDEIDRQLVGEKMASH